MNWYKLAKIQIHHFDEDDIYSGEDDSYRDKVFKGVQEAFKKSKINILRDKMITQVALKNGVVIGGVVSAWTEDRRFEDPDDVTSVFDFDVAVSPKYRGNSLVGIKLIEAAIRQYNHEKHAYENPIMRLYVINKRLIPILVNRFGFEVESSYENGEVAHLIRD